MIYDGDCGICTAQVSKLPWWDCQGKLAYLSLHDPEVQQRFPDLPHDRMMQEMVIVDRHGNRHWGPAAIRYLTRRLRRLWWAAPVLYFPGSMLVVATAVPVDCAESLSVERSKCATRVPASCISSEAARLRWCPQLTDRRQSAPIGSRRP